MRVEVDGHLALVVLDDRDLSGSSPAPVASRRRRGCHDDGRALRGFRLRLGHFHRRPARRSCAGPRRAGPRLRRPSSVEPGWLGAAPSNAWRNRARSWSARCPRARPRRGSESRTPAGRRARGTRGGRSRHRPGPTPATSGTPIRRRGSPRRRGARRTGSESWGDPPSTWQARRRPRHDEDDTEADPERRGGLVVRAAPQEESGDREQGQRHEEGAVAEQRGDAGAQPRPSGPTRSVASASPLSAAERDAAQRDRVGPVSVELGPGRLAEARSGFLVRSSWRRPCRSGATNASGWGVGGEDFVVATEGTVTPATQATAVISNPRSRRLPASRAP